MQTPRAAAAGRPPPGCTPATMYHDAPELGLGTLGAGVTPLGVGPMALGVGADQLGGQGGALTSALGGGGGAAAAGSSGSLSLLTVGGHAPPSTPAVSLLGGLTSD